MVSNLAIAVSLLPQPNSGGFDFSIFAQRSASAGGGGIFNAGSVHVALAQAEANEEKQLEQLRKSPTVQRDLERYAKVVAEAETLDDVIDDPVARRVLLKGFGLGDQADYVGLVKKALASDPSDQNSLANKLANINGAWLEMATKFNFSLFGLTELKTAASITEVSENYLGEMRLDDLDEQLPGLGTAILFKRVAASLDETVKVLGSALGREVVTTALGLPKEIALQSLVAQEKAVNQRLDITKLQDPEFVDRLVQRYLLQLNGGQAGVTA